MRALQIAATGMDAQQMRVEVISNNIANMSTTGYKSRRADFADLHYQQTTSPGALSSRTGTTLATGVQLGLGVRAASVSMLLEQGSIERTSQDFDFALEGKGFFQIELPSGDVAYTRDGSFKLDGQGTLVTSEGYPIADQITVPDDARRITANADGEIYAYFDGDPAGQLIGSLTIAGFANEKGLEAIGDNLFLETGASGAAVVGEPGQDGLARVRQGYLEQSTVDVVTEIAELIEAQRGYEMNSKVISASDQMLGATVQIR